MSGVRQVAAIRLLNARFPDFADAATNQLDVR